MVNRPCAYYFILLLLSPLITFSQGLESKKISGFVPEPLNIKEVLEPTIKVGEPESELKIAPDSLNITMATSNNDASSSPIINKKFAFSTNEAEPKPIVIQDILMNFALQSTPNNIYDYTIPFQSYGGAIGAIIVPYAFVSNGVYAFYTQTVSSAGINYWVNNQFGPYDLTGMNGGINYSFLNRAEIFAKFSYGTLFKRYHSNEPLTDDKQNILTLSLGAKFNLLNTKYVDLGIMINALGLNIYEGSHFTPLLQWLALSTFHFKHIIIGLSLGKTHQLNNHVYTKPLNEMDLGIALEIPLYRIPAFYISLITEFATYNIDTIYSLNNIRTKGNYFFNLAARASILENLLGVDIGVININTRNEDMLNIFLKINVHLSF